MTKVRRHLRLRFALACASIEKKQFIEHYGKCRDIIAECKRENSEISQILLTELLY